MHDEIGGSALIRPKGLGNMLGVDVKVKLMKANAAQMSHFQLTYLCPSFPSLF